MPPRRHASVIAAILALSVAVTGCKSVSNPFRSRPKPSAIPAGKRISLLELNDQLKVSDALKGQVPLGFLVLKAGVKRDHAEIVAEVVKLVRDRIGPVASFKTATVIQRLPKTRSGKVLRSTMQKIADGQSFKMPATIDDPLILDEIKVSLQKIGFAKGKIKRSRAQLSSCPSFSLTGCRAAKRNGG